MYPEDSIQALVGGWWVPTTGPLERGRLIRTHVQFPEMKPHRLTAVGRGDDARQHTRAQFLIEEFRISDPPPRTSTLPVAGLPLSPTESYMVRRGKDRPALVLSLGGAGVPPTRGSAKWQTQRAFLVAPFYGADQDGTRAGWQPAFVDRIRHGEYPQYVWDKLPVTGSDVSILRLDHTFAIGSDPAGYQALPFRLSDNALRFIDDWIRWLITDTLATNSDLAYVRSELLKIYDVAQQA
jgi:hypothetical protein